MGSENNGFIKQSSVICHHFVSITASTLLLLNTFYIKNLKVRWLGYVNSFTGILTVFPAYLTKTLKTCKTVKKQFRNFKVTTFQWKLEGLHFCSLILVKGFKKSIFWHLALTKVGLQVRLHLSELPVLLTKFFVS